MLNIPPHLEACRPRGLFSIFHGTSSPVARRCPRASDLVLSAEHAFLLYERPGLHLQSGASAVGGVLHGARRSSRCFSFGAICDFNPRAPCGARRRVGDTVYTLLNFNPRTPCGVRPHILYYKSSNHDFNPRTPCGVRRFKYTNFSYIYNFNPRTPCGVRPNPYRLLICSVGISIHAPRAGCDLISSITKAVIMISIHAPRAGCDSSFLTLIQFHKDFNPRTPCGVRQPVCCYRNYLIGISIHAPRAGCDGGSC